LKCVLRALPPLPAGGAFARICEDPEATCSMMIEKPILRLVAVAAGSTSYCDDNSLISC
jgi:hypothetical protein